MPFHLRHHTQKQTMSYKLVGQTMQVDQINVELHMTKPSLYTIENGLPLSGR